MKFLYYLCICWVYQVFTSLYNAREEGNLLVDDKSYPHPPLHLGAGFPLLLVKGMGVDVQRGGHLSMAQNP